MNAKDYYEEMRKSGFTDDITSNDEPDYNQAFYQSIFRLMEGFSQKRKITTVTEFDNATKSQHDAKLPVSGSLPSDDRIVAEATQAARKVNTEVGLLPNNNDIRMFCLGAKWMRDFAQSNYR